MTFHLRRPTWCINLRLAPKQTQTGRHKTTRPCSLFMSHYSSNCCCFPPSLDSVTSVLAVSQHCKMCWLLAVCFGFVRLDFTFCRLEIGYHFKETGLWVWAVSAYTAKKWARGLMDLGDKSFSSLVGIKKNDVLLNILPQKYRWNRL